MTTSTTIGRDMYTASRLCFSCTVVIFILTGTLTVTTLGTSTVSSSPVLTERKASYCIRHN